MLFKKKSKDVKCESCGKGSSSKYNFCPYCGVSLMDKFEETLDFGMIGKSDLRGDEHLRSNLPGDARLLDRVVSSMMSSLVKNMISEIKDAEVKNTPNSISIKIGSPGKNIRKEEKKISKSMSEEQIKRMSEMPRTTAKTAVKRIGDKIVYELNIPGIESPEDVFVSKLESGYEIKAISGNKKVYVNSLPVNLPIKSLAINPDRLYIEFKSEENNFN
ncbi:MAG: hypothetical protein Q8Q31_02290 [Nanoarchaeota archaeon]|nr:hypothetical protein [Nanoarchaeota archaeon]